MALAKRRGNTQGEWLPMQAVAVRGGGSDVNITYTSPREFTFALVSTGIRIEAPISQGAKLVNLMAYIAYPDGYGGFSITYQVSTDSYQNVASIGMDYSCAIVDGTFVANIRMALVPSEIDYHPNEGGMYVVY